MIADHDSRSRLSARAALGALLLAGAMTFSHVAPAQQGAKVAAESLFQAGKQLMADKKYAEACPKLAESQRLDPSPGTQLNLARCYELQGKTASAYTEYKGAAVLAQQAGQKDREQGARDLAKALEPKLSKLSIEAAPTPGLVVKSDGVEVGAASFGVPIFVDPGEHVVEASAPGFEPWSAKIKVGPNADSQTAKIPALTKRPEPVPGPTTTATVAPTATGPAPSVTASPTVAPTAAPTTPPPGGSGGMRTASYALMGVGVAGIAVGAVFGGLAMGDVGTARSDPSLCPDNVCTPAGRALVNDASTKALISSIALPVGLAAAGAGVVLFLVGGPSSPKAGAKPGSTTVAVRPVIAPGAGALSVTGKF